MKRNVYQVYIHLCQKSGKVLYAKCSCKAGAGAGGCCKHAAASLYQLVDFKELNLKSVTDDKTCTELLQKWHVPGEKENTEAILFSELTFEKADFNKDKNNSRKRPLVTGNRTFCATPLSAFEIPSEKIKKLSEDLKKCGQAMDLASTLKGNEFNQCTKFVTSVTEAKKNVDAQSFEIAENVE